MKKSILACVFLSSSFVVFSQTEDKKWNIGFHGGLTQYNGDLGQNFYQTNQAAYGFGGVSISRYLGRYVDVSLFGTRGEIGTVEPLNPGMNPEFPDHGHFRASLTTASLVFKVNFTGPQSVVRPYLFGGAGVMYYEAKYTVPEDKYDGAFPSFGGGIHFRLNEIIGLNIQETFMYANSDNIDRDVSGNMDGFVFHTAGLTFNLGEKKDADMDDVSDKKDQCPGTPLGVMVDEKGCPIDSDRDGVADYEDACPEVAGITGALKGCPDRDADGIADKDDRCPDHSGASKFAGCPDTDKDGVADVDDICAGTDSKYKVDLKGCPVDTDKDGVFDEDDRCATLAGLLSMKGCPDKDGDGVADIDDRCPNTKGTIENKGCPEIAIEDVKKITYIASKIFFEFNSDKLKAESMAQLDALVEILQRYEGANLLLEGHTDSKGDDAYNMDLSQRRMDSVKEYLMSKGIFESRLTARGYGESRPVADNKTEAGRKKNRRVELKTSY